MSGNLLLCCLVALYLVHGRFASHLTCVRSQPAFTMVNICPIAQFYHTFDCRQALQAFWSSSAFAFSIHQFYTSRDSTGILFFPGAGDATHEASSVSILKLYELYKLQLSMRFLQDGRSVEYSSRRRGRDVARTFSAPKSGSENDLGSIGYCHPMAFHRFTTEFHAIQIQ